MIRIATFREIEMGTNRFAIEATGVDGKDYWYTGNATGGELTLDQMFRLMDKINTNRIMNLKFWSPVH